MVLPTLVFNFGINSSPESHNIQGSFLCLWYQQTERKQQQEGTGLRQLAEH